MDDGDFRTYWDYLVASEHKAQAAYDRTLLTLATAGIGLSATLLVQSSVLQASGSMGLIQLAWAAWGLCLLCLVSSQFTSQRAYRDAMNQVSAEGSIPENPGGGYAIATDWLNGAAGVTFALGVILFGLFIVSGFGS